jgi:hypothetical protein
MTTQTVSRLAAIALAAWAVPATGAAQVFGTFPWQMQPYCNVVTLTLTNTPAGFTLDGADDQCGATNRGSALGVATFNAAGNVTLNFTIVTTPNGKPVHVSAVVSPANGQGTWTDSVANSGTFAFFGATPGLPVRPLPASGLAPSIISTTEIAAGAVGASDIDTAEVQARVTGTCPAGQAMSAISATGAATCWSTLDSTVDFRVGGNPTIAVPSSTPTSVTWSTVQYNNGGGTYSSAAGTYTVPFDGLYAVTSSVAWAAAAAATGYRCNYIYRNTVRISTVCGEPSTTASFVMPAVTTFARLAAGDTVSIRVQATGANNLAALPATESSFSVTRIR